MADSQTSHEQKFSFLQTCRRPKLLYIRLRKMHLPFSVPFLRPYIRRTPFSPSEACVCTTNLLTTLLRL